MRGALAPYRRAQQAARNRLEPDRRACRYRGGRGDQRHDRIVVSLSRWRRPARFDSTPLAHLVAGRPLRRSDRPVAGARLVTLAPPALVSRTCARGHAAAGNSRWPQRPDDPRRRSAELSRFSGVDLGGAALRPARGHPGDYDQRRVHDLGHDSLRGTVRISSAHPRRARDAALPGRRGAVGIVGRGAGL